MKTPRGLPFQTLLMLFSLLLFGEISAQRQTNNIENVFSIPLEQLSIADGLSQGMINDLAQDSSGYLWIATKDGLNRFDGVQFDVFRNQPNDSLSLSDNFVYSITIDSRGRLWVGTQSKGVNLYHPSSEDFTRFGKDAPIAANRLSSNFIGDVLHDQMGNVYVETLDSKGFNVIHEDQETGDFQVTPILEFIPALKSVVDTTDWTKYLAFDAYQNIWYTSGDSLFFIDSKEKYEEAEILSFHYPIKEREGVAGAELMLFDQDKKNFYISDGAQSFRKFNYNQRKFEEVFSIPEYWNLGRQLFIDKENRLWAWQEGGNVLRVNLRTGSIELIIPKWNRLEAGAKNHRGIALEDNMGNYWLETGGNGLVKICAVSDIFQTIPSHILTRDNDIRLHRIQVKGCKKVFDQSIYNLWIQCREKLDLKSENLKMSDLNAHLVYDQKGNFWYSAVAVDGSRQCLLKIVAATGEYTIVSESRNPLTEWYAMPIFLDNNDDVWFGERYTEDSVHLYHVNQRGAVESYTFPVSANKHQYRFISDVIQDESGLLWLGTTQGVFSFEPKTASWEHYKSDKDYNRSLSGDLVLSLCNDPLEPSQFLWVGTSGTGLNRLNKKTKEVERFQGTEILPNEVVYGILPDEYGQLWISTNYGLTWLNTKSLSTQIFTAAHGLPGNEFNRYEYSKTESGTLYFGGTSGVVYFQPEEFYAREAETTVRLNAVQVVNAPSGFEEGRVHGIPVPELRELTLPYDFSMLTLGFTTMDLTAPRADRFKYRLEGYNEDWLEAGVSNTATYTSLDPGEYIFKVLGCNSTNNWSVEPFELQLVITPPWYGTLWFKALTLIVVLAGLYMIYRVRLNQILEQERLRNRIAQDLHDEIGSTLSSISIYSTVLKKGIKEDKARKDTLERIRTSVSEVMEKMNDIVWTIKSENDDFVHVVNRMRAFTVKLTELKEIDFTMEVDPKVSNAKLGMNVRKSVYLIYKEAINNAIKYSECSRIEVRIRALPRRYALTIADNGKGFDPLKIANQGYNMGGNGIKGMYVRAKSVGAEVSVESSIGNGTVVRLIF